MKLNPIIISDWPKLAWVAEFGAIGKHVNVYHGAMLEIAEDWCVEAVWAGDFASGDFDQTDLVFGTGVRCRGNRIVFVTAGTAMDRLWYCFLGDQWYVSNSLGALSARAGISLDEGHSYVSDRESAFRTTWGVKSCVRSCPASPTAVNLVWFNNLVFDGKSLLEVEKPDSAPRFDRFSAYENFLFKTARALHENLADSARQHVVVPVATVSSGYDSPAAAVVAKHAGCDRAITIKQSSSFWRGSDSGMHIAERLGMVCRISDRTARSFPHEAAFWAGSGWSNLLNWTLFPYPETVGLFFQGNYGDAVWNRKLLSKPFTFEVWDDLGLGEFRLIVGMIQCPVPFWGMRHVEELNRISFSDEMGPWSVGGNYDRPIPRRIVEDVGVQRAEFGVLKKDTSHESGFRWPYSLDSQESFKKYLKVRGHFAPGRMTVSLLRFWARLESLVHQNLFRRLGVRKRFRPWRQLAGTRLLFQWANEQLKKKYEEGLRGMFPSQGVLNSGGMDAKLRQSMTGNLNVRETEKVDPHSFDKTWRSS